MKKLLTACEIFTKYLTGILLSAMVAVVFWNVVSRYFLGVSIAWSEEISRFMFLWVVFLGAVLAYIKDEHLSLDILIKAIPKKAAHAMQLVADLCVLYAIQIIVRGGYSLMMKSWDWLSPAAAIPYAFVYLIIPVAGAALFIMTIAKMIQHINIFLGKSKDKEDAAKEGGISC